MNFIAAIALFFLIDLVVVGIMALGVWILIKLDERMYEKYFDNHTIAVLKIDRWFGPLIDCAGILTVFVSLPLNIPIGIIRVVYPPFLEKVW